MQTRHNGFNLALGVIPRHADFPAQAQVQSDIRPDLIGVLDVRATITGAGIQELLAALVEADGRTDQEIGEVGTSLAAVKGEVAIGGAGIALIDLQVAKLTADLKGMQADYLRETFGEVPGIVWLKSREGGNADAERIEIDWWHGFWESRRSGRVNAQSRCARNETKVGQFGEAACWLVRHSGSAEEAHAQLVDGGRAKRLRIVHHELLSARGSDAGKA